MIISPRIRHRLRCLRQILHPPSLAVIGGYHYGNLGDMALGASVLEQLHVIGQQNAALQTIYNLSKWPHARRAILGGGAIGYRDTMAGIINRYGAAAGDVGVLGVDFNEKSYPEDVLEFLRGAAWISCRSRLQAERLSCLTGRNDISDHPDIAFALEKDFCAARRAERILPQCGQKILAINAVAIYGEMKRGRLVVGEAFRGERPEIYSSFDTLHHRYAEFLRSIAQRYASQGWRIVTVSFSPSDEAYARLVLGGNAEHRPYDPNPRRMLGFLSNCGMITATRFHATIFGIKLGLPLLPFAYATKNELLLRQSGITEESYSTPATLLSGKCTPDEPLTFGEDLTSSLESEAVTAIRKCIATVTSIGK